MTNPESRPFLIPLTIREASLLAQMADVKPPDVIGLWLISQGIVSSSIDDYDEALAVDEAAYSLSARGLIVDGPRPVQSLDAAVQNWASGTQLFVNVSTPSAITTVSHVAVGVGCTVLHVGGYGWLRLGFEPEIENAVEALSRTVTALLEQQEDTESNGSDGSVLAPELVEKGIDRVVSITASRSDGRSALGLARLDGEIVMLGKDLDLTSVDAMQRTQMLSDLVSPAQASGQ